MSYSNGLLLQNILSEKDCKKIVDFCEGRKLTIYREENIRACLFSDYNIAKKIENILKKKGLWDDDAIAVRAELMLYNYWDLLPKFTKKDLSRKTYTKTRTFLDTLGREIQIKLDIGDEKHLGFREKYILSTHFIKRKRVIEAPSNNPILLSTEQNWL